MFYCSNCGEPIEGIHDCCPACGHPFGEREKSLMTGEDLVEDTQESLEEEDSPKGPPKKIILLIVIIAACAAAVVIFFAVRYFSLGSSEEGTVIPDSEFSEAELGMEEEIALSDQEEESADQAEDTADSTANSTAQSGFVLPESDSRYYSDDELSALTADQLRIARNEIYARHGRKFDSPELQSYFDSQSWYTGTVEPSDFSENVLNQYEKANVLAIQSFETAASSGTQSASTGSSDFEESWKVIQSYGFDADSFITDQDYYTTDYDYSILSFFVFGGTAVDEGDYYTVQAEFEKPVTVPADLSPGETYTATVNDLTGETSTFTYLGEDSFGTKNYDSPDYGDCWEHNIDSSGRVVLDFASSDRIDSPFFDGVLRIRKDAITGNPISQQPYTTVDASTLASDDFFNAVAFDENGYIAQLIYVGD